MALIDIYKKSLESAEMNLQKAISEKITDSWNDEIKKIHVKSRKQYRDFWKFKINALKNTGEQIELF